MDASDDVVSRMIVYFHMKRFPRMQLVCDSTRMYYKRHIQFSYLFYKLFVTSLWYLAAILLVIIHDLKSWIKGVISAKMVKIVKFLFFAQKVSSGMGALRPKFLGG